MGRSTWLWGVILIIAGCASSPEVVMRNLPRAAAPRPSNASIQEVYLREAGVSGRSDRIFLSRVSLKNHTGHTLHFGPADVYVADADERLLYRISQKWLPEYYQSRFYDAPAVADHKAIRSFPSAEVRLADAVYAAPPSTRGERDKVATELGKLVEDTFVGPQHDAPGTFMDKAPEVILGTLLEEVTLGPGDGVSGYVYFYRPATERSPYPLRVIIKLEREIHTFVFQE